MVLVKGYSYLLCIFGFVSLILFIVFCIPVTKLVIKGMKYDDDVNELHEEIDSLRNDFEAVSEVVKDSILELIKKRKKDSKKIKINEYITDILREDIDRLIDDINYKFGDFDEDDTECDEDDDSEDDDSEDDDSEVSE